MKTHTHTHTHGKTISIKLFRLKLFDSAFLCFSNHIPLILVFAQYFTICAVLLFYFFFLLVGMLAVYGYSSWLIATNSALRVGLFWRGRHRDRTKWIRIGPVALGQEYRANFSVDIFLTRSFYPARPIPPDTRIPSVTHATLTVSPCETDERHRGDGHTQHYERSKCHSVSYLHSPLSLASAIIFLVLLKPL